MLEAIKEIYKHRQDFMIIGLTGRIGSGCSTIASYMQKNINDLSIADVSIAEDANDDIRKKYIIKKFFQKNWAPFYVIRASDVILTFILEKDFDTFKTYVLDKCNLDVSSLQNDFSDMHTKTIEMIEKLKRKISIDEEDDLQLLHEYLEQLSNLNQQIRKQLSAHSYRDFTKVFQSIGDNIRLHGAYENDSGEVNPENIYNISKRINLIIKAYAKYKQNKNEKAYFVIDAFRNPFEVMFFRERYSAFYLISVNCSEEDRIYRLLNNPSLSLTRDDINAQDEKENPDDLVKDLKSFVSQNIRACIEKSDLHIHNSGKHGNSNYNELKGQIIKYISLIQHPGLITPSRDEKMMQIAYTAKLNSGCISRQVGAVVTNKQQSLRAIGWNSVPDGQVACLFRNSDNLINGHDSSAYSNFEKNNPHFQEKARELKFSPSVESGLNNPFCFKDVKNTIDVPSSLQSHPAIKKMNNQVYTRALHAEENAFLQMAKYGGDALEGGTLYSTASPCELCSKKAYQLGIKRVVYIDPYPGIAREQILECGETEVTVDLFKGAIGLAYHKIYDPILTFKDELKALSSGI
jgi:dCMP deaminase